MPFKWPGLEVNTVVWQVALKVQTMCPKRLIAADKVPAEGNEASSRGRGHIWCVGQIHTSPVMHSVMWALRLLVGSSIQASVICL